MENPVVSVLITCYNHERYICEAINSVMQQTFGAFELVITDDGSNDRSRELIRKTAEEYHDDRIRLLLHEENTCFSCIDEAYSLMRGKYVVQIGGDDEMEPDRLAKQVRFLETHTGEYQACFTWVTILSDNQAVAERVAEKLNVQNRPVGAWLRLFLDQGNCLCAPSMMMLRTVNQELGGYHWIFRQLQDYDLWLRFMQRYQFWVIPEKLTRYRVIGGSLSDGNAPGVRARTLAEQEEVLYRAFRDMPADRIEDAFPDEDAEHHSEMDIACRKVIALMELSADSSGRQAALRLFFHFQQTPGFLQTLEGKYHIGRAEIHRYMAERSVYQQLINYIQSTVILGKMQKCHRFQENHLHKEDQELTEQLLDWIDGKKQEEPVSLDHICALYELCKRIPDGEAYFVQVLSECREQGIGLLS